MTFQLACYLAIQAQAVKSMVAEDVLEIHMQCSKFLACDLAIEAPGKRQQCFTCARYLLPNLFSTKQWKKKRAGAYHVLISSLRQDQ